MTRLHRPFIPLGVRLAVAGRQLGSPEAVAILEKAFPVKHIRLARMLNLLRASFGLDRDARLELHHVPALCNRPFRHNGEYMPPANDPDGLAYLPKDRHAVVTRVRGEGAQRSDLAQRRYLKKVARNRDPKRKRHQWPKGRKLGGRRK